MFITFEGIDGSGKTTQIKQAAAALRERRYRVLTTREPGGTALGDEIRRLLLDQSHDFNLTPRAELLLFCASRAQLVDEVVQPFLKSGGIVISDRYADSTLAYQGYGHGLDRDHLREILAFATGGLKPDLTIYLDLDPEIGLARRRRARLFSGEEWNRLDDQALAFHRRVYAGYEELIAAEPARWERVNAARPAEAVQAEVIAILNARLSQETHKYGC